MGASDKISSQGDNLPWRKWKTINRIQLEVENMCKWELITNVDCECGNEQTTRYLWECQIIPASGEIMDFVGQQLKYNAIKIAAFWEKKRI